MTKQELDEIRSFLYDLRLYMNKYDLEIYRKILSYIERDTRIKSYDYIKDPDSSPPKVEY